MTSPKDSAPAGFLPLEGIKCAALPDGRTFEIRPKVDGNHIKSVKMGEAESSGMCGCFGGGGGGGKKKKKRKKKAGGFEEGHHAYFAFKTVDASDPVPQPSETDLGTPRTAHASSPCQP